MKSAKIKGAGLIPVWIIKALLPDVGGNAALKIAHYFQGIGDVVRPALQPGGIVAVMTVNAWTVDINACAGFMHLNHANAWLDIIGLPEASAVLYGYWNADSNVIVTAQGKPKKRKPIFILDDDTTKRISILPPLERENLN